MRRRLQIAWDHSQEFFGRRALVVGLIPLIFWLLQRFLFDVPVTNEIVLLAASYALVGCVVFIVQFLDAGSALIEENDNQKYIDTFTPEEQKELRLLVRAGKIRVGHPLLDAMALAKARRFIRRDYDDWRVEPKYDRFLKRWLKRNPEP